MGQVGQYLIGIDGGTESLRAGVFTATGALVGSCSVAYPTRFPRPGWAEQDPADWWSCLGAACKGALQQANIRREDVAGLCVDTTCCTVCVLDEDGDAVRPALLWMDMRSAAEAARVAATGDPAIRVNSAGHGPVSAEWMVPKSLWLKTHEPSTWEKAAHVCEYQDYINWKLTGVYVGSLNNASVRWHYDIARGWPESLLHSLDLSDLIPCWPQRLIAPGDVVGHLTEAAAAHTGLREGLLVAQGGADAFIGMLGLGVTQPGQMALLTGSSHLQLGLSAQQVTGKGIFGSYNSALLPGLHVVEGGQTSTGSIVNWFKRTLCDPAVTYEQLNEEAAAVPPGCDGLLCLDHFQGNRTPHTDALSRGALSGLTLAHGRGHVFRALMEGVAYGTRLILDTMRSAGYAPATIAIAGGATRSELWLQIHADAANTPFILTEQTEAPMLGCAILASVAAGLHADIPAAARAMVNVTHTIMPQPHMQALYEPHYQRYCQLYPALAPLQPGRHKHQDAGNAEQGGGKQQVVQQPQPHVQAQLTTADEAAGHGHGPGQALQGIVAASILAADFARLADEATAALSSGASWIHVDMFDGSNLPRGNWTIGPPVLKALRAALPSTFLDCHLAVDDPLPHVHAVAAAGASSITFHWESPGLTAPHTLQQLQSQQHMTSQQADVSSVASRLEAAAGMARLIRSLGLHVGVALCRDTPVEDVLQLASSGLLDMVLIMSVQPGWGGQDFLPCTIERVQQLRTACPHINIQVDGGVNGSTVAAVAHAGANVLVAGSAIFKHPDDTTQHCAATRTYRTSVSVLLDALKDAGFAAQQAR